MKTTPIVLAALLLTGANLHGQASADSIPACADGGISRLAVTVPPGKTREELVQSLQQSTAIPEGTQIRILADREMPAIVNGREFDDRLRMHRVRFLHRGLEVNGDAQTLVEVNADGVVTEVHAASGHRDVDRGLRDLWRRARFEPVLIGECRAPAWLHVNLRFASEFTHDERWVETRVNP